MDFLERQFEKSEIAVKNKDFDIFYNVDENESIKQFKIIQLINKILKIDYRYSEPYDNFAEKNRHVILMNSEKSNEKFKKFYLKNLDNIITTEKIIKDLSLPFTTKSFLEDFNGDRILLINIFKDFFSKYNLNFSELSYTIFFRSKKIQNNFSLDYIDLLTYETRFCFGLKHQFDFGKNLKYASGIFSIFFMRSAGLLNPDNNYKIEDDDYQVFKDRLIYNNPFILEKSIIEIFARNILLCDKIKNSK